MSEREGKLERALFMCATHCQGGHSEAGAATAEILGVPFPLTMDSLGKAALAKGYNPRELWPWWATAPRPVESRGPEKTPAKDLTDAELRVEQGRVEKLWDSMFEPDESGEVFEGHG